MPHLILLRHGQSLWNQANLFTGWVDVPLSEKGIEEAVQAGKQLAQYDIDAIYTSTLGRAQQTAMLAMANHPSGKVPVVLHDDKQHQQRCKIYSAATAAKTIPTYIDWRLNERFYGALQGLDKDEMRQKYGKEQVHIWRRSFDIAPPEGDSLKTTAERTLPCLSERIMPELQADKTILVSAHGNSLRSIIMALEKLSPEEILKVEIATGVPRVYEFKNEQFTLLS